MSILITGSSGFIGTNFCKYLIVKEKKFIGVDLVRNPYIKLNKFYKINLKNYYKLEKLFIKNKIEKIVHFAAVSGLNSCQSNPRKAFDHNIISTINILELSKKYNIKKLVLISSFSSTNFYLKPSIYGFTKLSTEQLGICYNKVFNLPVTVIKLSNIYGPYSLHKESAIHRFIRQKINLDKLTIHDSGNQLRDFVFVSDVSKKIYKLINQKKIKILYNCCSGKNTSILKMKKLIDKISKQKSDNKYMKAPPGYDTSVIKKINKPDINFSFTSLEEGLLKTYKWYKENYRNKLI